uniref:hypothetical protein n=1 Tax=Hassallia byssoidea TaxID=482630 RepID=UPI001F374A5C
MSDIIPAVHLQGKLMQWKSPFYTRMLAEVGVSQKLDKNGQACFKDPQHPTSHSDVRASRLR